MKVVMIQRVVPHYRIALFNEVYKILKSKNSEFKVICGKDIANTKLKNVESPPSYVSISLKGNRILADRIKLYYNLFGRLVKEKPGLIITEGGSNTINNIQVYLYSRLFDIPYVVLDLGKLANLREQKSKVFEYPYFMLYKKITRSSRSILTYNNAGSTYFTNKLNISPERIQILYNTINEKAIFEAQRHPVTDSKFEKFSENFKSILIFVGAINHQKNLDFLAALQKNLDTRYAFLIIGDGEYKEELQKLMGKENTFFAGHITDLSRLAYYYGKSKIFILPGLGGLSINQSLAYGVPVLCSEADGSEYDLIIPGKTGYILPKNDVLNWVDKINEMCSFEKNHFSVDCMEHMRNNISFDKAVSNFIKVMDIEEN